MSAIDELREDMHRIEDTVGDLRDRVSKHEGQDEARHIAQMAGQADIKAEVLRIGDAVRTLTGRLEVPGGLSEVPSKDSDRGALTARVRFPSPPSFVTAARWGLVLAAIGSPFALTVLGMVYAVPPSQVQAAVRAIEAIAPAIEQAAPVDPPSGPAPLPVEGQE